MTDAPGGRAVASIRHPLTRALLVLTFTTGMIDAVSFLALGSVFSAIQTGNVVLLGFALAGWGELKVLAPLISLVCFACGALVGGLVAARLAHRHPSHVAAALGIEAVLIGAAACFAALVEVRPDEPSGFLVVGALALARGVRTTTALRLGVPDMTTIVNTLSLAGLAADSPLAGGSGAGSVRRIVALLAMLAGALLGALLLEESIALPLAVVAGAALVTLLVYVSWARRANAGWPAS